MCTWVRVYLGECVPGCVCTWVDVYLGECVPGCVCTWVDVYLEGVYLMGVYLVGVLPGVRGCPRAHLPAQGVLGPGSTMLPSVVKRQSLLALLILLWLNPGGSVQKQHWPGRETTPWFVHVASVTEKGRAGSSPHSPGIILMTVL